MNTLQRKGYIRRDPNRSRSIEVIDRRPMIEAESLSAKGENVPGPEYRAESLPLLGRIAAGRPVEAFANQEALSLQEFVGNRNVYVLQVKGDSMIEDPHLRWGFCVVVESTNRADNGDTVVALGGRERSHAEALLSREGWPPSTSTGQLVHGADLYGDRRIGDPRQGHWGPAQVLAGTGTMAETPSSQPSESSECRAAQDCRKAAGRGIFGLFRRGLCSGSPDGHCPQGTLTSPPAPGPRRW